MLNQIEKLRHKPEGVRKNILLITTFIITGFIVLIWAYTLQFRFNSVAAKKPDSSIESPKPITLITGSIQKSISDIKSNTSVYFNKEQ